MTGRPLPLLALLYPVGRFFLDFLRATDIPYADARYLGLTLAQYVCIALFVYGVAQLPRPGRGQLHLRPTGEAAAHSR